MKFNTTNRVDLVNILMLIDAVTEGVSLSYLDVYEYINLTDKDLLELVSEKSAQLLVNV